MSKVATSSYTVWQHSLFWVAWLSLFIPVYFIGYGFALVGRLVLHGYHETVDIVLVMIMGTALVEMFLVAIYTLTRFRNHDGSFKRLLGWLMLGIAGIPLAATLGCIYSYATLAMH